MRLKICGSHSRCKVADKWLNICERLEASERLPCENFDLKEKNVGHKWVKDILIISVFFYPIMHHHIMDGDAVKLVINGL